MDIEQVREAAPLKSPWRDAERVRWTVIGHEVAGDAVTVRISRTTDARVKAEVPAEAFFADYSRIP